ncbi:ATP-binding protein [Chitinivibrio alkaliphilus]|uniref:DNA mismatch repair protein n=1 Tax=Chitinivibrio alkaliphilus ACht1 TaxID=1313304 RepID=U7DAK4_9BACT|nr:ATP-binding protein [Chitinivibrio alkaliphilus]ERP39062.1 DNA mismatch repair protein [Chitinivibrio alkaliphilus ACht1]
MSRKQTLPPNPARLIEGLRDTGYDFNTALADIVDNSVDAGATKIDIRINMDPDGDILVSVADDGCGMDEQALLNGMTYGAQGLVDPKRLGKFGLGLKTASTAFCRRLSVITRSSGENSLVKATWDLDHVVNASEWELLLDVPIEFEEDLLNEVAPSSSGTLVMWDKVDRMMKNYSEPGGKHARNALDRVVTGFRDHAAMVYQRFLNVTDERSRNIKIILNGQTVAPWDPFCEDEGDTELVAEKKLEAELPDGSPVEFSIRAFVLPRREYFSSQEAAKRARLTNNMQGIYIYRENRLIHPADWLGMFTKEPHLSLLRVEFSFTHESDEAFQVDIKKSRILLNEELYNWVLNEFLPAPRNAANERYRRGQRKKVSDEAKDAHEGSNRSISSKEQDLRNAEVTVVDSAAGDVEVKNKSGTVRLKLKVSESTAPRQVCVQPADSIDDGILWAPAIIDGHHAVRVNTGHPYYHKVYVPNLASDVTIQGMDSLLWALVEAELGTINEATKNHFEELRFEVSRLLRKLVEDLPEPDLED